MCKSRSVIGNRLGELNLDWQKSIRPLVEKLQKSLVSSKKTVATAESCTGGMVATLLTDLPGSSKYFLGGVAAYANSVKNELLGVTAQVLKCHGAVSAEVAEAMAKGVRSLLHADYSVSLTGIAGPGGGTQEKPVGTVYCGIAGPKRSRVELFQINGDRFEIRCEAARLALKELLVEIEY
jgi:nicotinamide-nucleotide amidase